jgi:ATP-binding cassette subfamily F protein 2
LDDDENGDGEGKAQPDTAAVAASDAEKEADGMFVRKTDHLTATGILLSHARSKDIQIDKFSVAAYGQQLVSDTSLNLMYGRKYGLVGSNGCGKSTLLRCLAHREVPIQSTVDLYLLEREYDPTDLTAVEAVVEIVKTEKDNLEAEMEELLSTVEGAESERMDFVQERLNELDLSFAEQKARKVLKGLGFTEEMQDMTTKEFSGGWRMRVALARALFVKPTVLLLDDATNHLDLSAVVWLENYLLTYPHTIIMVSHSQDLLNSVCTDIMYLSNRKLEYFAGNYDNFVKVKAELDENARKKAKADEKKLKKIKENLGRTGAQAKQAKSHEKAYQKRMEKDGIPEVDTSILLPARKLEFNFKDCGGGLPSPFLKFNDVS